MIVEERCYTLKPGTVQLYYQDYSARGLKIQQPILGNLIGYFHTEIGELNQIVHMWGYNSLAERERRRALLGRERRMAGLSQAVAGHHPEDGNPHFDSGAVFADQITRAFAEAAQTRP